ncbi:MAG: DUF2147 domain-containing protein [Dokdonella sp.]|uniref:DUF2147 domain-containing protein n=1 Tax=Dokdonella sp. TaxID=2291710 RepID=UPI0032664BA5
MLHFRQTALLSLALAIGVPALAADISPVGTWTSIDDATGKPKSIVQITETGGKLEGKVLEVLQSDQGPHPVCKECDGDRKNQPIEGMTIIWDVQKDGDVWDGGKILDPKNGKTYKVKLTLTDNGQKLDVHGYVGFAMLGRSQVWERKAP